MSLSCRYRFKNFAQALTFVNQLSVFAEAADHHPDILIEYKNVTLTLTTHDEGGLSARDFSLAARIDA